MGRLELPLVVFEATAACNLRCRYCYNVWNRPGGGAAPRSSYRVARRVLRRLFGQAAVRSISISGGEPFLAERLSELVLECRLRGAAVTIITNGSGGDRDGYATMRQLGVSSFELPLHSPSAEIHDAMTGVAGSWARSRRSIEEIRALGGSVVGVVVITRLNHLVVADAMRALIDLGAEWILLNRFNVGGRGVGERAALAPGRAELEAAFRAANEVAAVSGVKVASGVCTPMCVLDPRRYPAISWSFCSPEPRRRPLTLTAEGDLRFCNHSPVVAGNVLRQPLAEILACDRFREWAEAVPALCAGCDRFDRCRGGCRAASEQLGRSLASADPILDDLAEPARA